MIFVPAIDLVNGEVVRLYQGDPDKKKVYFHSALEAVEYFVSCGIAYLHIVDLDGAIFGKPQKEVFECISKRLRSGACRFQWAGGIRDFEYLRYLLRNGASKAVLSTKAFSDKSFLERALHDFPGRIIVSLDFRDNAVWIYGWGKPASLGSADKVLGDFISMGCSDFIITDISSDGTLNGARLDFFKSILQKVNADFYLAGGISSLDDVIKIKEAGISNVRGIISGRAVYEGCIDISEVQRVLRG